MRIMTDFNWGLAKLGTLYISLSALAGLDDGFVAFESAVAKKQHRSMRDFDFKIAQFQNY